MFTCYSPVCHCTGRVAPAFSFDLHVLGTPPALILSQDQTLQLDSIGVPTPVAQSQDSLVLQDSFKGMNLGTLYLVFKDLGRQSVILGFLPQGVMTFADPNPANPCPREESIIAARGETTRGKVLAAGSGPPSPRDCLTGVPVCL